MGVAIKDLLKKEDININSLKGKIVVIDAYNNLYQYLSSIRQIDGSLLTDTKGRVTSHLIGLFSRTTKLMKKGIKIAFVFDGDAPDLKSLEREKRKKIKIEAEKKYDEAKKKNDLSEMKKYGSRTSRLTTEMVEEAKRLVRALGLPVIQAPSEGEAQAAYMVKKGNAYAVISQDYDSLLYGGERVLQDLNVSNKRKKTNALVYKTIKPKMLILSDTLNQLGIGLDQLIALSMLVGTDYNLGGIKGIGPKNALKLVKQYGQNFDDLFKEQGWAEFFDYPWTDVYYTIKKMKVIDDYDLSWKPIDENALFTLLVKEHDFSKDRVTKTLEGLNKGKEEKQQKGLSEFF